MNVMALAVHTLPDFAREMRLASRLLARRPGFAAAAVATIALGIGAPAAIFTVVHAVLLRPLPYPEPDRLIQFRIEGHGPAGPIVFEALPASEALEWGQGSATAEGVALFDERALTLSSDDGPFRLMGVAATPNLFDVLGVKPAIGRTFDGRSLNTRVVVLSHDLWQRFFRADPAIVGRAIVLDGDRYVVSGVMPREFGFPTPQAAFWVPLLLEPGGSRGMLLPVVARLRAGATPEAAAEEVRRVAGDMGLGNSALFVRTLQDQLVGGVRRLLWVLMAAASFVFVIATANIALLLLTRGVAREHEFAIRLALGAGRLRLLRQLSAEALTLALLGGTAGLLLATLAVEVLVRLAPPDVPRLRDVTLDGAVLGFTSALTLAASLAFAVLSAGRAIATDLARARGGVGHAWTGRARASRRRLHLLAAGELALTMVLLVGAGLLLRSFANVLLLDQGFRDRAALALEVNLPGARYPVPAARLAFHERLLERLKSVHGLAAVGLTTAMPNRQPSARVIYSAAGLPALEDRFSMPVTEVRTVSEGFFEAMGIPLRSGRGFRAGDVAGAEPVIVISERLARQQVADRNPIGELLYSHNGTRRVVGDVRPAAPGADIVAAAYLPIRQNEEVFQWYGTVTIVARGRHLDEVAATLRALVLSLDPEMPTFNVRTLTEEVSRLVAAPRFGATLLAVFAIVALVLAAVGVHGVVSYSTVQRTQEIGVRIALGATRGQIARLIIRDGLLIIGAGLLVGLIAASWMARALTGLLHEVTPADPIALAAVAAVLLVVGVLSAYLPRRATRISTLDALRDT